MCSWWKVNRHIRANDLRMSCGNNRKKKYILKSMAQSFYNTSEISSISQIITVRSSSRLVVKVRFWTVTNILKKIVEMKILQLIEKNLMIFGSPEHPFNNRNLLSLFTFILSIISACIYFFCKAKTFLEYTNSIFMITALIAAVIIFGYVVLELRSILQCFIKAQKIIDRSEIWFIYFIFVRLEFYYILNFISELRYPASKTIYEESNRITEKITEILKTFPIMIFYSAFMAPILIFNFYTYFTSDLGNDSFQLFFPYWWAQHMLFSFRIA